MLQTINWKNDWLIFILRMAFGLAMGLKYVAYTTVQSVIEERRQAREAQGLTEPKIWLKKASGLNIMEMIGFGSNHTVGERPEDWEEWTYDELENEIAQKGLDSLAQTILFNFGLSAMAGVHIPLAMGTLNVPMELLNTAVVWKYLFGMEFDRPYEELLHNPNVVHPLQQQGKVIGDVSAEAVQAIDDGYNWRMEHLIFTSWESEDGFPLAEVEGVLGKVPTGEVDDPSSLKINYKTVKEGWTLLMVACGRHDIDAAVLTKLFQYKAAPFLQDADGWTALHWAAYHRSHTAIKALQSALTKEGADRLVQIKSTAGIDGEKDTPLTAIDVAFDEPTKALLKKFRIEKTS